jgi:hypothetical protein
MDTYPINAPIDFTNTDVGNVLNFNAPSGGAQNVIQNFITTAPGDLMVGSTLAGNILAALPIGATNTVLMSNGSMPYWAQQVGDDAVFSATVSGQTGTTAGYPTSRSGGANVGVWFTINNTYNIWTEITDDDGVFNPLTGVFTVPTTGVYQLSAQVTFDYGPGYTPGSVMGAPAPLGRAVRQARIYNTTSASVVSVSSVQNAPSSNDNFTVVSLPVTNVALTAGDELVVQVRHDRSGSNTVTIGDTAKAVSGQTYFAGKRLK